MHVRYLISRNPGVFVRPVCLHMIFSTLYTNLPQKLVDLTEKNSKEKTLFILHIMIGVLFFLSLKRSEIIIHGLVRLYAELLPGLGQYLF